ncbi:unnamed protein product [Heligmosomoides polygyrus]|uniref:TSP1_spondin domain-containing protein n=1 Tax=Heligmosomoides polygyrus TaxID=6339 RepID=A0A183G9L8_HELPZ|nr:unnamed protein product [Heligmosomoides polygyrus]
MCVPTLASMDSSPCPARQGDPCAPKSLCPNAPQVVPSVWAEWGLCSQTCGAGTRTRQCSGIGPLSAFHDFGMLRVNKQRCSCNPARKAEGTGTCPAWHESSDRSKTSCNSVGCLGPAVESCSMIAICQEWSQWNTWTACSATCGEGERKRTRECIGGRDCPGVSMASRSPHVVHFLDLVVNPDMKSTLFLQAPIFMLQTVETCAAPPCPSWTDWSPWEGCSITCGTGQERRSRTCQVHACFHSDLLLSYSGFRARLRHESRGGWDGCLVGLGVESEPGICRLHPIPGSSFGLLSRPTKSSIPGFGELVPDLSGKTKALICSSVGHHKSLYGQIRSQSASTTSCRSIRLSHKSPPCFSTIQCGFRWRSFHSAIHGSERE